MVKVKDSNSKPLSIIHGVPQGSILGPWLFNVYINDLSFYLRTNPPVQYADDTTMIDEDNDMDSLIIKVQSTLNLFSNWSIVNYLSLNTSKTKYMMFSKKQFIGPMVPLLIKNDPLQKVNSIKFLGVHIDSNLNFKIHIKCLRLKLARLVGLTYIIGPNMNMAAARSFYFALVHSQVLNLYLVLFSGA
jgi:hypothetical protein